MKLLSAMTMMTLPILSTLYACNSRPSSHSTELINSEATGASGELVQACSAGDMSSEALTQDDVICEEIVSRVVEPCGDNRTRIGDSIGADMTLNGCYETAGFTVEEGVTLTLSPGADLRFLDSDASIQVEGTLVAEGTAEDPIYLNGGVTKGSWGGVRLINNSAGNRFSHVIFENGGGFDWNTGEAENAMLVIQDDPVEVSISYTTFRGSSGYGLHLASPHSITRLEAVEFEDNDQGAARIPPNQMRAFAANLAFGEEQWVFVERGDVTDDQTWESCIPWRFVDGVQLMDDARITIAAGSTLTFEASGFLEVEQATLSAIGAPNQAVVFTGLEKEPGAWGGIHFKSEVSTQPNTLDYVMIEFAGGFDWNTSAVDNAAIALQGDTASVLLSHSVIRDSSALGIFVERPDASLTVQQTRFEANVAAAEVPPNLMEAFNHTSSYLDGQDVIISGGAITQDTTASGCVPYLVSQAFTVTEAARLTLEPGADLRFETNVGLEVKGELSAEGVEDNVVTLHGVTGELGAWGGVRLVDAGVANLDWVALKQGGGIDWNTSASRAANLNVTSSNVMINMSNITLSGSAGGGIYLNEAPMMTCDNIKIEDDPAVFGVLDDLASVCD